MKTDIMVLFGAMLVTLTVAFIVFNSNLSLTGFAISELNKTNDSFVNVSEQMALDSIGKAEEIMYKMYNNNLSVNLINDTILQAKIVFEQVRYAKILRNPDSDLKSKSEATNALRLVAWRDINYSDVIVYTDKVSKISEQAFLILDKIKSLEGDNYGLSPETLILFEEAKSAFREERYNNADNLITQFRDARENELAQESSLSGIAEGAKNFFQRYWLPLIVFLAVFYLLGKMFIRAHSRKRLVKKIRRMKFEQSALTDLMKKTQTERFKENKISGLVYNIRMKSYKERANDIKEQLPILEERLDGMKSGLF
jgi:hypothetical protein